MFSIQRPYQRANMHKSREKYVCMYNCICIIRRTNLVTMMMHAIVTDKCDGVSKTIGFQSVNVRLRCKRWKIWWRRRRKYEQKTMNCRCTRHEFEYIVCCTSVHNVLLNRLMLNAAIAVVSCNKTHCNPFTSYIQQHCHWRHWQLAIYISISLRNIFSSAIT